jgi:hypothetical protein
MSKKVTAVLMMMMAVAGSAFAGPYWLTNPVDQQWTNNANWDSGSAPGAYAYPSMSQTQASGKFPIISTDVGTMGAVYVGHEGDGYLSIISGSLGTGDFMIGVGHVGEINISGGTVTSTGNIYMGTSGGTATIDISGASTVVTANIVRMRSADAGGAGGTINLNGGVFNVADLRMGTEYDNGVPYSRLLNITGGVMYWTGTDWSGTLQSYIDAGYVKGYGSSANVRYAYDSGNNWVKVWAVPEPASMVLIGFGILGLRRKSR